MGWKLSVLHEKKVKFSEEYFFLTFAAILKLIYFCYGPTTRSNSPKQALGSLCGFGRVWWKMKNCILSLALSGQFFWLPQVLIFWLWEAPQPEPYEIFLWDMIQNQKINNLSKTVSSVEIFQREFRKIINLVKKVVKNRLFRPFFQLKRVIALWIH